MKSSNTNTTQTGDTRFIRQILSYYDKHGRKDLVWRRNITPYSVLVSEVMLQQTQSARVIPKYELWMKKYPNLPTLSKANLSDILKLWQGLGYHRRAKALLDIAKGTKVLPKTYEELLKLKSIGPYTASAIMSFAYNEFPDRLLETNIRTVLIEAFHQGETKIHDGTLYDDLARLTKHKLVQETGARAWYYALMDYGAYLKSQNISHNQKSAHHMKQSPYEGSLRQLRAKILFAIAHKEKLPEDERRDTVVEELLRSGYIKKSGRGYRVA
jgi:A/G-specific adenine glycosylase